MIRFRPALLAENLKSTKLLTQASWLELEHQLEYDPDWQLLVRLEQMGHLHLYQVTSMGKVAGAAVVITSPSTHQKGKVNATVDFIFIRPHNRGVGARFLEYIEDRLREKGVHALTVGLPPRYGDAPKFLDRTHYRKTDHLFTRTL